MGNIIKIYFDNPKKFEPGNIKPLNGITGLYFIFSQSIKIQYPFERSKLLYIGMSEKKTNSIGSRLMSHFDGKSNNVGLISYRKVDNLFFTYINFDVLKNTWYLNIESLESYFILDFVKQFGTHPICNNKTGSELPEHNFKTSFTVDWKYFS